jgi:hypothetical protein
MGSLEDILSAGGLGGYGERSGEIGQVDTRRQEIQLYSRWGGNEYVRYDGRTEVVYRQRRYAVRDLERGDLVRMRIEQDRGTVPYTSYIEVQESVRDREGRVGGADRLQRVEGEVRAIDVNRGWFELRQSNGNIVDVTLPYDPSRAVLDRFHRLRRGNRVRVEGWLLNAYRMELNRFL